MPMYVYTYVHIYIHIYTYAFLFLSLFAAIPIFDCNSYLLALFLALFLAPPTSLDTGRAWCKALQFQTAFWRFRKTHCNSYFLALFLALFLAPPTSLDTGRAWCKALKFRTAFWLFRKTRCLGVDSPEKALLAKTVQGTKDGLGASLKSLAIDIKSPQLFKIEHILLCSWGHCHPFQ